ncbi:MAG TPA: hypothetical protein VMV10_13225 [Pirellulales bacterium]|nr:hypothetical protein [Pirellulales bacterium]
MSDSNSKNGPIPAWRFVLRLTWVVIQLLLVYWLGESGVQFVYQGF